MGHRHGTQAQKDSERRWREVSRAFCGYSGVPMAMFGVAVKVVRPRTSGQGHYNVTPRDEAQR